ncbi:MAG TPA: GNAT family N-acetyltransferase [Candidatus Limnocylindrales bacterium]|nr:GNAT family N-acetyltransferase [Candidatus Limnocylindrales bacterium]
MSVRRAVPSDEAAAWEIVDEYNTSFGVVLRDDRAALREYLDGTGAMWLAYQDGALVGCVVLRPLRSIGPRASEVKRLYVRPAHRGAGVAGALMDALEAHARAAGYDAIYLDSRPDFQAAIRFYQRRGYAPVARYNENPEATVFMRLPLG